MKNEISKIINENFNVALSCQKEKTSLAGEPVSVKFDYVKIRGGKVNLIYSVIGIKTKHIYEEKVQCVFESIVFPYYYVEVLRLALVTKWSGSHLRRKDRKRFLFVLEYGEKNKPYLNKSLKYLHILRALFYKKTI